MDGGKCWNVWVELTDSWKQVFPARLQQRLKFAETRSASAILAATSPGEFVEVVEVLTCFELDIDRLVRPGGSKSRIAKELDESFRKVGWREARCDQRLETRLSLFRWAGSEREEEDQIKMTVNEYGGHKVDNVKNRAALDVEWNSKDGNLDRDISNYTALYDAGIIDVGILITRSHDLKQPVEELIQQVKSITWSMAENEASSQWIYRISKTPDKPYGTSTTANFEKLVPRLERGDGRGCPILAIGIGWDTYTGPIAGVEAEVRRLATLLES